MTFDFSFTPTDQDVRVDVPFFEDARADFAPYYDTKRTIQEARAEVVAELGKLGAGILGFREGYFGTKGRRYGYIIEVMYGGGKGRIVVAGLPMKGQATETKILKVRLQALLNVRDWLKAAVTAQVFAPESDMLMQYLLVDGQQTMAQAVRTTGKFPLLMQPAIDGEIVE